MQLSLAYFFGCLAAGSRTTSRSIKISSTNTNWCSLLNLQIFRGGLSKYIGVAIVLVIIIVGITAFFLLAGNNTQSSTGSTISPTFSAGVTSPAQSIITITSTISTSILTSTNTYPSGPPPVNLTPLVYSLSALLGNFSQLTFYVTINGSRWNESIALISETSAYLNAKFTLTQLASGATNSTQTSSAIIWYNVGNSTPQTVQISGRNYTGATALVEGKNVTLPLTTYFNYVNLLVRNSSTFSDFSPVTEATRSFGSVSMNVTTYELQYSELPAAELNIASDLTITRAVFNIGDGTGEGRQAAALMTAIVITSNEGTFSMTLESAS